MAEVAGGKLTFSAEQLGFQGGESSLRRQSLAVGGAGVTGLHAIFETADFLAVGGAAAADFGADAADQRVLLRAADHEVGASLADFRAGHHKAQMLLAEFVVATRQAFVHDCLKTDSMAVETALDAFLHLRTG